MNFVELPFVTASGEVSRGEKMLYAGTDPESYITEYTLVNEDTVSDVVCGFQVLGSGFSSPSRGGGGGRTCAPTTSTALSLSLSLPLSLSQFRRDRSFSSTINPLRTDPATKGSTSTISPGTNLPSLSLFLSSLSLFLAISICFWIRLSGLGVDLPVAEEAGVHVPPPLRLHGDHCTGQTTGPNPLYHRDD